ncbi:MAG: antibiotic biosynthesis monooxygenase [Thermodesulfobacteriota bacterium]|jgi:heme-degrading monooxygenase HmoA
MVIVVFRSRLREDANLEELARLYERLYTLVSAMPGFISVKDFQANDGEAVSIAVFDSLDAVTAWRAHSEHQAAQERGRNEFFSEYSIQVCTMVRASHFPPQ